MMFWLRRACCATGVLTFRLLTLTRPMPPAAALRMVLFAITSRRAPWRTMIPQRERGAAWPSGETPMMLFRTVLPSALPDMTWMPSMVLET